MTQREQEVVELVLRGLSNAAIAEILFVAEKTIKFHLTNIFIKCGVKSRSELMAKMFDERVTDQEFRDFKQLLK